MESIKNIYRIGNGPSSSQTMGPKKAAQRFLAKHPENASFRVTLYGGLAATGRGNLNDTAILDILIGKQIEVLWETDVFLDRHPNALKREAIDSTNQVQDEWTVYSIGGGTIIDDTSSIESSQIYPHRSMAEILTYCQKKSPMMASVDNWEIKLTGKGSHGSMPEKSIDPIVAGASLVMALQTIVSRNVAPMQSAVVTVGAFIAGDAGNVIPQSAILRLGIRSTDDEIRRLVLNRVREITAAQAQAYGVSHELREGQPGAILVNDEARTKFSAQVAQEVFGVDKVLIEAPKLMGSQDFAFFLQEKPGSYCFIGNGDTPLPHNPDYQFDDRNLAIGAAYWVALAEAFLK